MPRPGQKLSHTLTDHALGAGFAHVHDPGEDHDHEHDADDSLLADGSQALARVELLSIGVDIGSSGTQIAFSRLTMHGPGEPAALRRQVKSRETLSLSPVWLTPYRPDDTIDENRLRGSLARAFAEAGLRPDEIDTGVVIMTGAAARRANAQAILNALSLESGDIVAAAVGHHFEAALAAQGSGAVDRSRRDMARILNIDIGGGTAKFALIENGRIRATAALDIGGRQFALDASGALERLEPSARRHAHRCGFNWEPGHTPSRAEIDAVAERCADELILAAQGGAVSEELWLTEPLSGPACEGVMFSGGVAEYVYGREARSFGDLGPALGRALAKRIHAGALPVPVLPPGECIRATVLGCSEHTVQLSGATSYISSPARLLPRRNLPVLQPPFAFTDAIEAHALAQAIGAHRRAFGDNDARAEAAFAFRWRGDAEHSRIRAFAEGLRLGLADRIAAGAPLFLMLEGDAALSLGAVLREELGLPNDLLVLDGLVLRDFDYVDLGRIRLPSGMVPVTVKSLQFGAAK